MEVLQRRWWDGIGSSDAPLTASTPLGGPEVDSLDLVELVMVLEEEFDLDVPVEEAEDIRSIGDVIRYLERRLRGGAAG
nr:phosphopantetheine-binding protein [Aeoliella straminimaris]